MKKKQDGFSMIELLVVLIIVGIMAGIAMQSMTSTVATTKVEETKAELDRIAFAIAGNPSLTSSGGRTDFGYVGDIGSLPPNLTALFTNPGGYSTWQGPYLYDELSTDGNGTSFLTDAWGAVYTYTGGVTIASNGNGSSITRTVAASANDLLRNSLRITVTDRAGVPPGSTYDDSVRLVLTIPNGIGGTSIKQKTPSANGLAIFDSVPIGSHLLQVIDLRTSDTIRRRLSIPPNSDQSLAIATATTGWGTASTTLLQDTIRPSGTGAASNLTPSGAANNWDCVNDLTNDNDATYAAGSGTAKQDSYATSDPSLSTGTIDSLVVYAWVRSLENDGRVRLSLYVSLHTYTGNLNVLNTSGSYSLIRFKFATNPSNGLPWTFGQIQAAQLGIRIRRQVRVSQIYGVLYVTQ